MAKNGLIDEVVTKGALSGLDKLNEKLTKSVELLESAIKASGNKNPFGDPQKAAEITKAVNEVQISEQQLNKEIALRIKAEKELAALQAKQAEQQKKKVKLSLDEQAASKEAAKIKRLEAQLARSVAGSYNSLSAQYELNRIKINKLAIEGKKLSDADKQLIKDTANLRSEMKRSQEATGNHTLNVGNYSSALQKFGGAIKTIAFGAVTAGLALLNRALSGTTTTALDAEKSVQRLSFAIKNVGGGNQSDIDKIEKQAAILMGIFDDEQIKDAATTMLNYGLSVKQVSNIMPLLVDAAAASGKSLDEMALAVDKGITSGVMARSALGQLGLQFKDTGSYAKNYAKIVEGLSKFSEGNTEAMKSEWGQMQAMKVQWGEVREQLGFVLTEAVMPLANGIAYLNRIWQSAEEKMIASTDRITQGRLASFNKKLIWQKDKIKYINEEITAEQNLYKSEQKQIETNKQLIEKDKAKGFFFQSTDYQSSLKKQNEGLQISINRSIAYVNALAGLRQDVKEGIGEFDMFEDKIVKTTNATERQAEAYNKLGLLLKPVINKTKELASSEILSYGDRRLAAADWADFMQMSEAGSLKIKEDALYKEYQDALKTTKDKKSLDLWYKTEKEKIEIESSNNSIEIEDEYSKMLSKIKDEELKEFKGNAEKQADIDEKAKDEAIKRAEAIKAKLDQLKEDVKHGVYDMVYQTLDAVSVLFDKINEKESESLSKKQDEDEKAFDKKEELINNSLISEVDKQEQLDALDAERVKNQEEYAKKETELKKKQAIENAIISAAMIWARYYETIASYTAAQAAFAATALGNPIAVAAGEVLYGTLRGQALAQALIGTAAVAIPAFEKGGEMKHDGLAMVSEKRQEWGINPDGSVFLTPERPSIVQLQKGARIFPDASQMTNEAIMKVSADAAVYNFSTKDMEAAFSREIKGLKAEIRKLQPVKEKNSLMNDINRSNVLRRFKN